MNQTMTPDTEETYPNNWDDIEKGNQLATKTIKLKGGEGVRFRILQGPLAYSKCFIDLPEKDDKGKNKKLVLTLPFGTQIPGQKVTSQYLFEVFVTEGPMAGAHKLLDAGQGIANDLKKARAKWKDLRLCDISIDREGSGQFDTKYSVQAVPPTEIQKDLLKPTFNLNMEVSYSSQEDIDKVPAAKPSNIGGGTLEGKISRDQVDFISKLATTKDLSPAAVSKEISRKFPGKTDLDDLTKSEASQLIDILKAH
jgi:hypothetical protein